NGNVGYRYFAVNNDSIYDYWNDVRWFKFPYQFGTSSVHAYTVVSSEVTQFYSRVAADGTGTLVIPGYTLTNILKVNHYLLIKRSSSNHGWTTTTKTDLFYCALSKFPILTISYDYDYNWIHQSNSKVSGYVNAELPVKWKFVGDPRLEPFALFPNPITDNKVLLSVNQPYDEVDLLMYDGFGKLVLSQRIRGVSDNEIDLTGIGQGVYIVQIKSPASSEFKKIVVQ
ncbi:MAG: Secretion system C-terminal sorting domain, partial [Bacteroidetes bacterium]|nr:Secretion system C-terminal sorting domain [Bacteroidota bacterium]